MTIIEIQDEYVIRVLDSRTRHIRRVKRDAWRSARVKLERMGHTYSEATAIVRQAHRMVILIQRALAVDTDA